MTMEFIIGAIVACAAVIPVAWLLWRNEKKQLSATSELLLKAEKSALETELQTTKQQLQQTQEEVEVLKEQTSTLAKEKAELDKQLSVSNSLLEAHKANEEKEKKTREAYEQKQLQLLKEQFVNTSEKLLKDRAEELKTSNSSAMGNIVNPLQQELEQMRKLITDTRSSNEKNISSLEGALGTMLKQTQQLGKDATNLADALKNRGKVHGDWGEQVLENILADSGMREGVEYVVQCSFKGEGGNELRTDVVVNCADGSRIVIDSKVSLTAYADYVGAENEVEKQEAVKQNYQSILKHIKELSEKNYPKYIDGAIPYSLMFVPNEGSYILAMNYDASIGQKAFKQGVILLNPTNLMMALYLVLQTWRNTRQEENCKKIIDVATGLHDKFVGLYDTCTLLGGQIATVNKTYGKVVNQLSEGSGNLMGRVEKLVELGVPSTKRIKQKVQKNPEQMLLEE